jgi:hypothetical protein
MQLAAFKPTLPAPPRVRIILTPTNTVLLAWPATSTGFLLQQNPDFTTTNWETVVDAAVPVGSENQAIISSSGVQRFYRLKSP